MTQVTLTRQEGHICAIKAFGHTGFAGEGEDIVCAALSSIIQTALLGLLQVAQLPVEFKRDDDEGLLQFSLGDLNKEERRNADMILETMTAGIKDLYETFSRFISIKEVRK